MLVSLLFTPSKQGAVNIKSLAGALLVLHFALIVLFIVLVDWNRCSVQLSTSEDGYALKK